MQSCAVKAAFAIFLAFWLLSAFLPTQARAQTFTVLHTFHGSDGASPEGVVIRDGAGNIYGTTVGGGSGRCSEFGCGAAFMLNKAGKEVALYSFNGGNGYGPMAGLLLDAAGNFYGTTIDGGKITQTCGGVQAGGCGVAFRLTRTGKETFYEFRGTPDGYFPESVLVEDGAGNLYGTTYLGGAYGLGTVFKIDTAGKETVLHSFAGPPEGGGDGAFSYTGVILDASGNLYGVTVGGGAYGAGVVYKLNASGEETLLYSFSGGSDGDGPDSVLLFDPQGNLYGTTKNGGSSVVCDGGCGTVFELSPGNGNGGWKETVLYSFCSLSDCADGEQPLTGPLVRDSDGNLYGTTYFGGTYRNCNGDACGVVFKLDTTGNETVLHSFTGGSDGAFPYAGLTMDGSGNLYGTAQAGGAMCYTSYTCGVVFKITP